MSKRKPKYSILIVCEGTNTEPNYFKGIREEVMKDENIWTEGVSISIKPKPPIEEEEEEAPLQPHKTPRTKKKIKETKEVSKLEIEDTYKAYPTRFVREAQIGLEEEAFDEAWAVFDKDYHTNHKEAFILADKGIKGKKVGIVFSSISFEHWILLHFEKNNNAFRKSECKDIKNNKKKKINCGTHTHPDDCNGTVCVIGYLFEKGYLNTNPKGSPFDLYSLLKGRTNKAMENALWLRSVNKGDPIYTLNPYTTVDVLVKNLLKLKVNNQWVGIGEEIEFQGLIISIDKMPEKRIKILVHNNLKSSQIFIPNLTFYMNDRPIKWIKLDFGIIFPGETSSIDTDASSTIVKTSFNQVKLSRHGHTIMLSLD